MTFWWYISEQKFRFTEEKPDEREKCPAKHLDSENIQIINIWVLF